MFRTILLFVCLAWAAVVQAAPVVIVVPPELYAAHAAADQAKAAAGKDRGAAEAALQKALKLKSPAAIAAAKDAVAAAEVKCRAANETADKASHALNVAPIDLTALAFENNQHADALAAAMLLLTPHEEGLVLDGGQWEGVLKVVAFSGKTPEEKAAVRARLLGLAAVDTAQNHREALIDAVVKGPGAEPADTADLDALLLGGRSTDSRLVATITMRHSVPGEPIRTTCCNAQTFVDDCKRDIRRKQGRATVSDLAPIVQRIVDGKGPWTSQTSDVSKAFAAKLPDGYYKQMFNGEFVDAAKTAFGKARLSETDADYLLWIDRVRAAIVANDLYYNGRAIEFIKWINGSVATCPVPELMPAATSGVPGRGKQ